MLDIAPKHAQFVEYLPPPIEEAQEVQPRLPVFTRPMGARALSVLIGPGDRITYTAADEKKEGDGSSGNGKTSGGERRVPPRKGGVGGEEPKPNGSQPKEEDK